ncbi:MAG: carbohydrate ABC transporter permease [Treponema sp.]|jgi:putative aldouronate transport system permease protein|nr:carbohydrate ABC transporter permease [Treponema sp.]
MVNRKKRGGISMTFSEKTGAAVIYIFLFSFCVVCVFPFLNVFFKSISDEASVLAGEIKYWPKNVNWNAYRYVLSQKIIYQTFGNTLFVVVIGTFLAILINSMMAYCLSRKRFLEQGIILKLHIFTMIFSAGLIPGYLLVRSLGLYNSLWALILPALVNPFNLLIIRSFINNIPESVEEAAKIDGAGHFTIFFTIILPVSKPVLASMCLFFAVDYWNDFFRALIFLTSERKFTLQLYLRNLLVSTNDLMFQNSIDPLVYGNIAPQSIQNATIFVSIVPILLVYPFLQRYFVTGITLGSVKG